MEQIDLKYEDEVNQLHEMLQEAVERNRILQQQIEMERRMESRPSNDTLLLGGMDH